VSECSETESREPKFDYA